MPVCQSALGAPLLMDHPLGEPIDTLNLREGEDVDFDGFDRRDVRHAQKERLGDRPKLSSLRRPGQSVNRTVDPGISRWSAGT